MHPKEQLRDDLKTAMKSGDELRKSTIRMALAAVKNAEVDKRGELDEEETLAILRREVKQRRETIADAEKAGKGELAEESQAEIVILEAYLPEQLSREEITEHARAVITEMGAETPQDTGKVMGPLMGRLKGQADGKLVNEVVRELLGS